MENKGERRSVSSEASGTCVLIVSAIVIASMVPLVHGFGFCSYQKNVKHLQLFVS